MSEKSREGKPGNRTTEEALRAFVRTEGLGFLEDPNISSIGVGKKTVDGREQLCVQFTVKQRAEDDAQLEELSARTGTKRLPATLEIGGIEFPTDVIQRSYVPSYRIVVETLKPKRKLRHDPMAPGISVSHPAGTAGTLGAIVYDRNDGTPCILSNWHVLHGPEGKLGDDTVQPGPYDDNRVKRNRAGTLLRSHLGHAGDCAISRIVERAFVPEVLGLGAVVECLGEPALGDRVVKSGRTTGVTYGVVRRVDVMVKLDYEGDVGEQIVGGFEVGLDVDHLPENGEVSMGGDSGSVWFAADGSAATNVMLGLHFAGEGPTSSDEHALACYASSVFEKLEIQPTQPSVDNVVPVPVGEPTPAGTGIGLGYDTDFLDVRVELPGLRGHASDAYNRSGSKVIHHTHFSLSLSKSRRLARYVAWNIDGSSLKRLPRSSSWFSDDPLVDSGYQTDNGAYRSNPLDRGHIARRADLTWGPMEEARRANRESFFWTNIAPQHEAFNQSAKYGLWGELENAVFEDAEIERLRVSVFGGPVLTPADPRYRGIQLPRAFWKLLAYKEAGSGKLRAKAYVLTQRDLLRNLEAFDLDPFRLWQVSILNLADMIGLKFSSSLVEADNLTPEAIPQGVVGVAPVREVGSRAGLLNPLP